MSSNVGNPALSVVNVLSSEAEGTDDGSTLAKPRTQITRVAEERVDRRLTMANRTLKLFDEADGSDQRCSWTNERVGKHDPCFGKVMYSSRTSMQALRDVIDTLNDDQLSAVREIGFGSLLNIQSLDLDLEVVSWLVDNFNFEENTLDVHGCSVKVTAEDVEHVIGLASKGTSIDALEKGWYVDQLLEEELNIKVTDEEVVMSSIKKSLLMMKSHGIEFKVKFALLAIGKLLAPSWKCECRRTLIPFVHEVDLMKQMNWAKFVLDELLIGIRRSRENRNPNIDGCIVFLVIFYLEHFSLKGDAFVPIKIRAAPRLQYWCKEKMRTRISRLKQSGAMEGAKVEVIAEDSMYYAASYLDSGRECLLERRVNEIEEVNRCLRQEYVEIRHSMASMSQALDSMQGAIVKELRRLTENITMSKAMTTRPDEFVGVDDMQNIACKNKYSIRSKLPQSHLRDQARRLEGAFTASNNEDLPEAAIGDERDASIEMTSPQKMPGIDSSPQKMPSVEIVEEISAPAGKARREADSDSKRSIRKALLFQNPDSDMSITSSTGSAKYRLTSAFGRRLANRARIPLVKDRRAIAKKKLTPKHNNVVQMSYFGDQR